MKIEDFREKLKYYVELFLKIKDDKDAPIQIRLNIKNVITLFIEVPISSIDSYGCAEISFQELTSGKRVYAEYFENYYRGNKLCSSWELFTESVNTVLNEFQMFEEFFAELDTNLLEKV